MVPCKRILQRCAGIVLGLLGLGGWIAPVQAAVLHVPGDYPSIQVGIAAARAGDMVLVAPGIYFESLTMKSGVHIHGQPGAILDGSQTSGAIVRAWSGIERTAVLSGFVIRRGQRGGILLNQAGPTLRNNVITENHGPGIACLQASPRIINNIITHNAQGGIVCRYPKTAPVIAYNDLWQNRPADVLGCPLGAANHQEGPRFVDTQSDDYRLQDDSPLIDAGHPAAEFNDVDGSRSDMGVYGGPRTTRALQRRVATAPELLRHSLSFQGLPGIIDTPNATMVPSGSVDLGYNVKRDFNIFPGVDEQKNFNFAVGLLPRVTIGGRGTVANPEDGPFIARDISANAQLLLLQEGLWWPAIAVGFQDISGGNALFESKYLVLSKSLFGRLRGTAGFGTGPDTLEGLFGGAELALNRFITLMGEYDTDDFNAGLRLFPLPEKWQAYGIPRPTVDLIWQDGGDDFAWGISLRAGLGEAKFRAQRAARAHKRYSRWAPPAGEEINLQTVSEQLQAELIADGLENVRVTMVPLEQSTMVVVEYENRRYNRDELHGLGVVMGLTATQVPPLVTHMRLIVKNVNIPVLQVTTTVDDFLAFLNEQMSQSTFAHKIHLTNQVQRPVATPVAATRIGNRSWLKLDAMVRPGIDTRILTEVGVADLRFSLLLDAFMQLTPGMVVNVRGNIPVTHTQDFFAEGFAEGNPRIDRVLLHQALRLPLGRWSRFATGLMQWSLGRFALGQFSRRSRFPSIGFFTISQEEVGIANEMALTFFEGLVFFKSTLARVGSSPTDLDRWVALGNGRIRYPLWDLTLSLTGGRFRDGDQGIAADLSRFFGNTEIGVFIRHSDNGSQGGLRLGFPLTPAKELKPMRFRPRPPDLFAYEQRTTIFTDRNIIRNDIGRTLRTSHEVERVYWNRDRLYPAYIRQHLDTLKQAVRRWVDEAAASVHTEGRR